MLPEKIVEKLLELDGDKSIQFIVLFGSQALGNATPLSDVDIAVYYEGPPEKRFAFRRNALGYLPDAIDLHIFQDLPLYVQKEVLKGKMLYSTDFQFTFSVYRRVIQEYDDFEKYINEYLEPLRQEAGMSHESTG